MRVLFYCVFLSLAIGNAVFATQNSIVEFFAIGKPSFLKIHGESAEASQNLKIQDDIKTKEKKISGTVILKLDTFSTKMSLRDKHLKEKTFETQKYPEAILTIDPIIAPANQKTKSDFTGKLNFHGVEKPVKGTVELDTSNASTLNYSAQFSILLSDYSIPAPTFSGMTIDQKIDVTSTGKVNSAP